MKIAHFVWSFNIGGIETMLIDIMACQAHDGHDVRLVIINDDFDAGLVARIPDNVALTMMRRKPGSHSPLLLARINMLALSCDVVHCHQQNLPQLFAWPCRSRVVLTVHSIQSRLDTIPRICRVAAVSDEVADSLRHLGLKSEITIVPNGVPCSHIPYGKAMYYPGTFRIVQVGRILTQVKGQDILINALAHLSHMGIENVSVDFIGEGESENELRQLALDSGMGRRVHFLGLRDRKYIYSHLCCYHLMVHPARSEGFGLAVAEAMVAGLPVLVSDIKPLRRLVRQGELGNVFRRDDAHDCAESIARIMRNYGRALDKTELAHRHITTNFTIRAQVDAYSRLYNLLD